MKVRTFYLAAAVVALTICSVTSSCENNDPSPFTNPTMVAFFDNNCASCHKNGAYNAGAWLYDPSNDLSIQDHIEHVYNEVYVKKTMPPAGLSQADLDAFKAWYDAGHPSK